VAAVYDGCHLSQFVHFANFIICNYLIGSD